MARGVESPPILLSSAMVLRRSSGMAVGVIWAGEARLIVEASAQLDWLAVDRAAGVMDTGSIARNTGTESRLNVLESTSRRQWVVDADAAQAKGGSVLRSTGGRR